MGGGMTRSAAWLPVVVSALLIGGCAAPHQDRVMQGNSNGVVISYVGNVAETEPLARQFCARYERVPVLHETKPENVYYFCMRPGEMPHQSS